MSNLTDTERVNLVNHLREVFPAGARARLKYPRNTDVTVVEVVDTREEPVVRVRVPDGQVRSHPAANVTPLGHVATFDDGDMVTFHTSSVAVDIDGQMGSFYRPRPRVCQVTGFEWGRYILRELALDGTLGGEYAAWAWELCLRDVG